MKVTLSRHGAEVPEHREWLRQLTERDLAPHEDAVLLIARREGQLSVDRVREALRIDSVEARRTLASLRDEGVIRGRASETFALAEGSTLPSDTDSRIARGLVGKEPQSIHEISEWSQISVGSLRTRLRRLVADGWIHATAARRVVTARMS